ncbi:MAG: hypothetical protein HUU15_01085 [Candidatus Brocadiae bacterium]|nr:hypothetical protein [Candidatus Brocadiia bacterium]
MRLPAASLWILTLAAVTALAGDLPIQVAVGGAAAEKEPGASQGKTVTIPVTAEGADGMSAWLLIPDGVVPGRKYPLLFVLHGNGDNGQNRHKNMSRVSTREFPVFVLGVQYQQGTKFNDPRWPDEVCWRAFDGLIATSLREHPVDPAQLYLQGFSMGGGYTGMYSMALWKRDPAKFPFRALFFNSGMAFTPNPKVYPAVPHIGIYGSEETAVKGVVNVVKDMEVWGNALLRYGIPVEMHRIEGMGHQVNPRCHVIIRETMMVLCGPKDLPAPFEEGDLGAACSALRVGRWKEGMEALAVPAGGADAKLKAKAADLKKKAESWASTEMKRLDAAVADSLRRKAFDAEAWTRLRTLADVFPDPAKSLAKKLEDHAAKGADEIARRGEFLAARALEATDAKAAKAEYERLAAVAGSGVAPAAKHRLSWWMDPPAGR